MSRPIRVLARIMVSLCALPLSAQEPPRPTAETANVFLDCNTRGCDEQFFRTEIPYVNWVRNREDAGVHVLVTSEQTGAGGRFYTIRFIGLAINAGQEQTLERTSSQDATNDEVRRTLAGAFSLGLVPYLANTGVSERLSVNYQSPSEGGPAAAATPEDDPWNFWVFNISGNANLNGQSTSSFQRLNGSLSGNRITENLKVRLGTNLNYNKNEFEISTGTLTTIDRRLTFNGLLAWSLGDHWAAGPQLIVGSSTFLNQRFNTRFAPTVEYNIFPYSESTRRELTFSYQLGTNYSDYFEETIFFKNSESFVDQTVRATLDLREQWGSASISLQAGAFIEDFSRNRVSLFGDGNIRIFRGLSLNFFGGYSRIRDQIFLSRGGATDEEVLLRLRQLETDFTYFTFIGLRYTFGSIFNNVVNSRMDSLQGGEFFFF